MNFENLCVVELNEQEMIEIDGGGKKINAFVGMLVGMGVAYLIF